MNVVMGLRHEDFAVLGQLCAKSITYCNCLQRYTKCSCCETIRKISNEFYQKELTIIIILVMAPKLEKICSFFSSFNPFPSFPSIATDSRKKFQCCKIVFNNKARPLFLEFN